MLQQSTLASLLRQDKQFVAHYEQSALMRLITSEKVNNKATRDRFLDCIQIFSNYFQKTVALRHFLCEAPHVMLIAQAHFDEELNHNLLLRCRFS